MRLRVARLMRAMLSGLLVLSLSGCFVSRNAGGDLAIDVPDEFSLGAKIFFTITTMLILGGLYYLHITYD